MVDIDQLTNEQIRDQLTAHGCDPGPVVGSTRNVYVNKLRRLLKEESKSNIVTQPKGVTSSDAAGNKSSSKRRDSSHKSHSPRRTTRSSAQEVSSLSKVQNTPLNSKLSQALPRTVDVSSTKSHIISDIKKSVPKSRVVQPSIHTPPKPHTNVGLETFAEVNTVPESNSSPSVPSVTSESASLDVTSNSFKLPKPYLFEKTAEVYGTPTTRFTSLRDNWENRKVSDGSDDDLRGEESSRILLPSWKEDHAYSARHDSKESSVMRNYSDEDFASHYKQPLRYSSGAMFENSHTGHVSRRIDSVDKEKASRSYGKIVFFLLFTIIAVIFIFFVVQNYAELELGEGNKEEF